MRTHVLIALGVGLAVGLAGGLAPVSVAAEAARASRAPTCHGVRATIVGTARDDILVGTPGRDVIVAGRGDDVVRGRGGRDLICGGRGADTIEGGPGRDQLHGGPDGRTSSPEYCLGDRLDGGPGGDLIDPGFDSRRAGMDGCGTREQIRFRHGGAVHVDLSTGVARGQGHDRIVVAGQGLEVVGSDADDVLLGSDLGEWFEPGPGNDTVEAGAGDDRVVESREANGDDTYDLGAGADFLVTWRGHDRVDGGDGADYLSLRNPEASRVDGGAGDDRIERQAAPDGDVLAGGPGDDELTADLESTDAEAAVLDIAAGSFVMGERMLTVADFERWTIQVPVPLTVYGSEERDVVTAPGRGLTDAPLTAYLFGGNDAAYAARADDYVDGGDGMDLAVLGSGTNTCVNVESDC